MGQGISNVAQSVISGVGDTTATVTDHKALQVTPPTEGKTAFGEALMAQLSQVLGYTFPYGINQLLTYVKENQSGTVTSSNSMATVSTGAATNSSAKLLSHKQLKYNTGLGMRARFTGVFTTGVAGSTQEIGIGSVGQALAFGYNGTEFGILHRYGGAPEIRTLTVSTKSTTAENITITLDGDAIATVAVTDATATDATTTANEIAAADYSDVGEGWDAYAVGSTVVFISWAAASKTGTYSLSGASTAAGSFAQTLAGASPTKDEWIPQPSWNGDDKFDGTGITGVTLDPTKGNVFQIAAQYLGFGAMGFDIEDPDDGELHRVHTIEYANANTRPLLDNPTLSLYATSSNTTNNTNISLSIGSMAAFIDGKLTYKGIEHAITHTKTIATASETPVLSFRLNEVFGGVRNLTQMKIQLVSASVEHTKPVALKFYLNPTLTGASFSAIDGSNSALYKDTSATAISGGRLLFPIALGKTGDKFIDFSESSDNHLYHPSDLITITAVPSSGTNADVTISVTILELI